MRCEIVVLGFSLIVLILIAGCTSSSSGSSPVATNQNAASGSSNIRATSSGSPSLQVSTTVCSLPPQDPQRFKKFFPNIPGWVRQYGDSHRDGFNVAYNPRKICNNYNCFISIWDNYDNSTPSNKIRIRVLFADAGPCVSEENGGNAEIKNEVAGGLVATDIIHYSNTTATHSFISNFHGYPAIKTITKDDKTGNMLFVTTRIIIKNSLVIEIDDSNGYGQSHSLSDAEANIEKFASSMDFNAIALSV